MAMVSNIRGGGPPATTKIKKKKRVPSADVNGASSVDVITAAAASRGDVTAAAASLEGLGAHNTFESPWQPTAPSATRTDREATESTRGAVAAEGLLRVKRPRKRTTEREIQELRSALAPLAAAGAVTPFGASRLLLDVASTAESRPHLQQGSNQPHREFQQHSEEDVRALEDLLVRYRFPLLRSCLLASPSPSLQSLVLQRLAAAAGAFSAAFSPFRLLSCTVAHGRAASLCPSGDQILRTNTAKNASSQEIRYREGGDDEGQALVAFLFFLRDALEAAPAAAISFDTETGHILRGPGPQKRRSAVPFKHVDARQSNSDCQKASSKRNGSQQSSDTAAKSKAGTITSINSFQEGSGVRQDSRHNGGNIHDTNAGGLRSLGACGGDSKSSSKQRKKNARIHKNSEFLRDMRHVSGDEDVENSSKRGEKEALVDWFTFTFEAPTQVHVVGSFPLNLTTCFSKNIDVCAMMPSHMFGARDHLNYRYFNKRNVYIQQLYEHLRDVFAAFFSPSLPFAAEALAHRLPHSRSDATALTASDAPSAAATTTTNAAAAQSARGAINAASIRPFTEAAAEDPLTSSSTCAAAASAAAAFPRCAASAAAFKAAAAHVVPRVFLQAWHGSVQKPVIAIRFLPVSVVMARKKREQQKVLSAAAAGYPEQVAAFEHLEERLEHEQGRPLYGQQQQVQQRLLQWVVRILAVPGEWTPVEDEHKKQHHRSSSNSSNTNQSNVRKTVDSSGSSSRGGDKRNPFAEHMLAVDRNCVRRPTTCCRSLSLAVSAVTSTSPYKATSFDKVETSAGLVGCDDHPPKEVGELPPTPYYNMLLLEDLRLRQHQRLLYRCCKLYGDGFRQAVLLLKVWALRRGLVAGANSACLASFLPAGAVPWLPALTNSRGTGEDEALWWTETSDVSGFLLAMLCCHACLTAANTLTAPVLAQQLMTLTFSFLAQADFYRFIYILGDPQPHRRQQDLKTLRAALLSSSHHAAATAAAGGNKGARGAGGLRHGDKKSALTAFPGSEVPAQTGGTGEEKGERVLATTLAVGLMDEAYLFDSPSCSFNLLWRAQLHIAELQQEAKSSLQAIIQRSRADIYHLLLAPPSSVTPTPMAARAASTREVRCSSSRSSDNAHLHLLLQSGDVQLYIPRVPQQAQLYFPAVAYPLGNYMPCIQPLLPRTRRESTAAAAEVVGASGAAHFRRAIDVSALDATPKWENPHHFLLAASILRLLVRGLGDRLRCYRVRMRRSCCPPHGTRAAQSRGTPTTTAAAPSTASAPQSAADMGAGNDAFGEAEIAGQPLAWTGKTAGDFLQEGRYAHTGLVIHLELNAAAAARLVEKGPSAAVGALSTATMPETGLRPCVARSEAVESFREFWGPERVEVRRFQDAQTLFSVVWDRPSDEDQQLHALLGASFGPSGAAATAPTLALAPSSHCSGADGGGVIAAANSFSQQQQQRQQQRLSIHPPPHTQVISHLLQRHLSHLLSLVTAENLQRQQPQSSSITTVQKTHVVAPLTKGIYSIIKHERGADEGADASDAGACFLESTPLGGVPSLSSRHKRLAQTFNELRNTICSLSSLPLAVKQIWHAGSALRFADALPLSAFDEPASSPEAGGAAAGAGGAEAAAEGTGIDYMLHRVVVEFEDSAAWPEDAAAVRHVKIAFLLAMRKELLSDHGICGVVSPCGFLDIELGLFTFRVVIFHPAEAAAAAALYAEPRWEPLYTYLRQRARHTEYVASRDSSCTSSSHPPLLLAGNIVTSEVGRKKYKRKKKRLGERLEEEAQTAAIAAQQQQQLFLLFNNIDTEDENAILANSPFSAPLFARKNLTAGEHDDEMQRLYYLRCMWWEPQVAAVLHACALRYPAFAGCVRLVKRWVAEKQLPACMHLVEHIVTVVFVDACKWGFPDPPQSVHVAFLRFLHLVAAFDWATEPLFVCFDPDASLGVQREQLMRLSYEKFHLYPSVQSVFDPHGFVIPLPDVATFTRFVRSASSSLASILRIPFCPFLASRIWKDVFSFDGWSSMDFVLFQRTSFSMNKTRSYKRRYANDFRPSTLPACLESLSFGSGEAAAVAQLLLRAASSNKQQAEALRGNCQPGARMLFSPSYVKRFLFLRILRELLCGVWTGNELELCASTPCLLGMRSAISIAYNPLKAALQGGGMPAVIGIKLNTPLARSGAFSVFLARALQPNIVFPRCCFSRNTDAEEGQSRQSGADQAIATNGEQEADTISTDEGSRTIADCSQVLDCLNPVLLMAGLFAAGGELVESIQIGGC